MLQHFVQMVLRSIWHEGTHITRIVYFVLNLTLTLNLGKPSIVQCPAKNLIRLVWVQTPPPPLETKYETFLAGH